MLILLISDDAAMERSLRLMLDVKFKIQTVQIGQTGFDISALRDYDLILLDLNGPVEIGLDIVRVLKALKIRVPLLVFHDNTAKMEIIKGLSADKSFLKPFNKDEVLAHIDARF